MGWVEQLKPDDEFEVEIIYPREYAIQSMETISKYSKGIALLCKGAAVLGEDETEFLVWGINILQTVCIEKIFRNFGVIMEHEQGKLPDGTRWTYFYADVRGLKEKLKEGDFDVDKC